MVHIVALVTDAFGGRGGIARYNRDFLTAISLCSWVKKVTVIPRACVEPLSAMPAKIEQYPPISSPAVYSASCALKMMTHLKPSAIFCGHLRMAPLGSALALAIRRPLWLQVHGIDAWDRPPRATILAANRASLVTAVSRYTKFRMEKWWDGEPQNLRVLPNTVGEKFWPGPKPKQLLDRYGLHDKRVILTVSRLTYADRYKGCERIIECLLEVSRTIPDAAYLIVGDGTDIPRLKSMAEGHALGDRVIFAGHVSDYELPDHYRVADVFAMPSTKEGFGIVFLEAALSGLPVIGGNCDGSLDALADGRIGLPIEPNARNELISALISALSCKHTSRRHEAERFCFESYQAQVERLLRRLVRS